MGSLNKVQLIGYAGAAPEKKITKDGATVVNLSLSTTDSYKDKQGEKKQNTEWHKVIFWNKVADIAESYIKKGSQVYLEGSLKTNEWTDKDGNKRKTTEVHAYSMQLLGSKDSNISGGPKDFANKQKLSMSDVAPLPDDNIEDDDLPF